MNLMKSKPSKQSSSLQENHKFLIEQTLTKLQNQCSDFFQDQQHKLFNSPFFKQNHSSLKTHVESTLFNLHNHAKNAIGSGLSSFSSPKNPIWARIGDNNASRGSGGVAMSNEAIEERLAGVPVYALSNSSEEFVLISGENSSRSLGLLCFKEEDAQALLEQMKSMDPGMRPNSKVVPVALNKVIQLKVDGVAFRLIPESSQIKNAIEERHKAGVSEESFAGVPVFQSKSLILRSQNKRYRPVFFRKEDLEKSLMKASRQQKYMNPSLKKGDIQVAVLEDIIHGMKDKSMNDWDDVVFIPPGFDVSADAPQR